MATDFASSREKVDRDFTNVVYKNYMQDEWGIESGFNIVPDWIAYARKDLLIWFEEQDCSDSLNNVANEQNGTLVTIITMPGVGVNPFPSIHCKKPCERRRFNPYPTGVFFEFNSKQL